MPMLGIAGVGIPTLGSAGSAIYFPLPFFNGIT
jgi:hypothetical protein